MSYLQNKIAEKVNEISKTADNFPGVVVIQNIQDLKIIFMSERGLRGLNRPKKEIIGMGITEYHETYFNPEDANEYLPKIQEMLARKVNHEMISFFQQVRTDVGGNWEWYLTSMKVLLYDEKEKPLLTITFAIPLETESHVNNKVNRLLEENNFLRKHHEKFYSLGKREKEILRLIALGMSNTEISLELNIAEVTVETHRKNIKRKLQIKSPFDLQQYARAFDLI